MDRRRGAIRDGYGTGYGTENALNPAPKRRLQSGMATTPLVGRSGELAALTSALRDATDGGRILLLTGDAGVGKTRLLTEFAAHPPLRARFLLGRGSARGQAVAFGLLMEALDPGLRRLPPDDLTRLARGRGRSLAGIAPALSLGSQPEPPTRLAVLDAVAASIEALAATGPLVVALDDVHQADPSTLEALDYLARNPPQARALLIAVARSEALAGDPALTALFDDLRKDDLARSLVIEPLSRDQVGELIDGATPEPAASRLRRLGVGTRAREPAPDGRPRRRARR